MTLQIFRRFSVNFAKFLRTPFLRNTSGRLLLYCFYNTTLFIAINTIIWNLLKKCFERVLVDNTTSTTVLTESHHHNLQHYCITILNPLDTDEGREGREWGGGGGRSYLLNFCRQGPLCKFIILRDFSTPLFGLIFPPHFRENDGWGPLPHPLTPHNLANYVYLLKFVLCWRVIKNF